MPQRRAFRTGRQVAGLAFTRLAKVHGHDSDAAIVVKRLAVNSQPLPQPVTGRIIPGYRGDMDPGTRGLADDQYPGRGTHAENRVGTQRQISLTVTALAHLGQQVGQ